jgi:putative addiction module antidote
MRGTMLTDAGRLRFFSRVGLNCYNPTGNRPGKPTGTIAVIISVITDDAVTELKITQIGNSLGLILPKEVLTRLGVSKGDRLFLVPDGDGYQLTQFDPEVARQMEIAEQISRRYRNTLKKLAE